MIWRALLIAAILLPAETFILSPTSAEAVVVIHRGGVYGRTVVAGHRGYYGGARRVARRTSRRVARRNYYY